ncbi:hypothetical protein ACTQY8_08545 [Collinsella bouchesdurhonensis]|uniref:hypothetical protein n=1 Tax=Collinsella bouchesdurhonensis TaxID=1907654 RepID=UPI003F92F015
MNWSGGCRVRYRVCFQGYGWLNWACDGESAGSQDYGKAILGIQIVLVAKDGGAAPSGSGDIFK